MDYLDELSLMLLPARSDSYLIVNLYYLLSLLSVVINLVLYIVTEVQNSLHEIEQLLGQSDSEICNIIKILLTNTNCYASDLLESL